MWEDDLVFVTMKGVDIMPNNKYCESTIKVGTFFSGIGAPEKAFQRLKEEGVIKDYKLEFFSEIDKNAIKSFCAIHNVDETLNLGKYYRY
ncbi:MAG: hypothetical protein L6V91_08605 [Bacilli bacterium]|nr:MAG: hypothetical protein L6V91_08605 [Bacilli bacterium]